MNPTLSLMLLLGAATTFPLPVSAAEKGVKMPVKEVTVFKDGHAFVLHEGVLPTDTAGNVVLDNLPAPVVGTFWPYSADRKVKLKGVTAGRRRVMRAKPALDLPQLIEANQGKKVLVTEYPASSKADAEPYEATILSVPRRGCRRPWLCKASRWCILGNSCRWTARESWWGEIRSTSRSSKS